MPFQGDFQHFRIGPPAAGVIVDAGDTVAEADDRDRFAVGEEPLRERSDAARLVPVLPAGRSPALSAVGPRSVLPGTVPQGKPSRVEQTGKRSASVQSSSGSEVAVQEFVGLFPGITANKRCSVEVSSYSTECLRRIE